MENSVKPPELLGAFDESGRSYRYLRSLLRPPDDFELTDDVRLELGLSGITLSRISSSKASRESISRAIRCKGDRFAPSSVLLSPVSDTEGSIAMSLVLLAFECVALRLSRVVGGVGGVLDGTCWTLATCVGLPSGLMSYCCTPWLRVSVNKTAVGP